MRQSLQEWFMQNQVDDDLFYKKAYERQVMFVRDKLRGAVCRSRDEYEKSEWLVISTHTSKSVKLPVYQIRVPGLVFTMRDNFYDWKVSVDSE